MQINYLEEEKKLFNFLSKKLPKMKYINLDNSIIPKKYKSNKVQINFNDDEPIWFFRFSVKNKDFYYCFGLKGQNKVKLILKINKDKLKSSLNFFSNGRIGIEIKFDKNYKKTFRLLNDEFTLRQTKGIEKRFFIMLVNDYYSEIIDNITKVIDLVNFNINFDEDYLLVNDVQLSEKAVKKLKIRSDYLLNRVKQLIKEYSSLLNEVSGELEHINGEFSDEELRKFKSEIQYNQRILSSYKNKCNNFKLLDEISEKIDNSYAEFEIIKNTINQHLSEIRMARYEAIRDRREEFDELLNKAQSILDNEMSTYNELNSKLIKLIDDTKQFDDHVDKEGLLVNIKRICIQLTQKFENLKIIEGELRKIDSNYYFEIPSLNTNIKLVNSIIGKLDQINFEIFEKQIKNVEEIYLNLPKIDKKDLSGNVEKLLEEYEKCFNRPMFKHQLKKYNLEKYELEYIKNDIMVDIVNKVITDENTNFKKIIIERCTEFRKNNSEVDENEIDNLLNNIDFLDLDENIVNECKIQVKKDFLEGNITLNQVELKVWNYINKKIKETNQLKELERIKTNPNVPRIKIYLSQEETNEIYILAKKEILSIYGIRGTVEDRVYYLVNQKIRENQSQARGRLNIIRRDFSNLTELNRNQQEEFTYQIEYFINENKIKPHDITEENIIKLSKDFMSYGKLKL